jgi:hypothetical protein
MKEIQRAFTEAGSARDKLLWRSTANATKLQDIDRNINNQEQ